MKKIVFFDFQGVLDVKNSHTIFDNDLFFQIKKQADPEKVYRLLKFIYEEKAYFASISSFSHSDVVEAIIGSLVHSDNDTYKNFANKFYFDDDFLNKLYFFKSNDLTKNDLLENEDLSDFNIVVFEDEAFFDKKYNPIYTNPSIGLTDEHILTAHNILNKGKFENE